MKNTSNNPRPSCRAGFDQKLLGYSALSAAALATSASAQIANITSISGASSLTLTGGAQSAAFSFSLGGAGRADGSWAGKFYAFAYAKLFLNSNGGAALANHGLRFFYPIGEGNPYFGRNFAFGAVIGGATFHHTVRIASTRFAPPGYGAGTHRTAAHGHFVPPAGASNVATGYVGFRETVGLNHYNGWLRIKVTADGNGNVTQMAFVPRAGTVDVFGAFNSVPNSTITAGQISAIPEPASVATGLALFALGAVGVREHRRRRLAV